MKHVLLKIKDSKADFIMELLRSFSYVKAKSLTPENAQLTKEIKEAVENLNLIKKGKLKGKPARDLYNEL